MIALLLACLTLDPLESNPFEDCNYSLEDAETWEESCYETRPYFEFGGIYTKVVEDYTTFDLIVSAAPEGAIGLYQVGLNIEAPDNWTLEEILTIDSFDGENICFDVDGTLIRFDGPENISADGEEVFVLTFDYSRLTTEEGDRFGLGFNREQTWFTPGGEEETTRFYDQAENSISESVAIEF